MAAAVAIVACGSTSFQSTWAAPDSGPLKLEEGTKVIAFFATNNTAKRRGLETALANELNEHGLDATAAYQIVPEDLDLDDDLGNSDGWQFQGGVVAKKRIEATMLSGSFSLGYADFDTKRNVFGGARAKGDQDLWLASAQFRGQPDTASLNLCGIQEPQVSCSSLTPRPVESWVPKRHQSEPTQVLQVRSALP